MYVYFPKQNRDLLSVWYYNPFFPLKNMLCAFIYIYIYIYEIVFLKMNFNLAKTFKVDFIIRV